MVWGGRREEGSGWGTHVYLWRIHFDIWQNQYNNVKFKNKIKLKKIIINLKVDYILSKILDKESVDYDFWTACFGKYIFTATH